MRKRPLFKNGPEISVLGLRLIAPPMAPRPRFGEQCLYEMKRREMSRRWRWCEKHWPWA